MKFVQSEFTIGKHCLKNMLIVLKGRVPANEFKHLLQDIKYLLLDLVKNPLVKFSGRKDTRVFQIDQMTGCFCLGKVKNPFKIADAHFTVDHYKIKDAKTRRIGTGQKNLGSQVNIEVL